MQVTAIVAAALVPRLWGITDTFVHPYDTAFQESLALSHLAYGLGVTKGIAGFGMFHGNFLFHAAHPPLLQLIYAGLYSLAGVHEWVSRGFNAILAAATAIMFWLALIKIGGRKSAFVTAVVLTLMPLSVEIGRTTNYEPGALFFISMIVLGFVTRGSRSGMLLMIVGVFLGGLFEWTVYLALPAVILAALYEERSIAAVKPCILPSISGAITLAAVLVWQKAVVGLIPLLGHAATRSDPRAVFDADAWIAISTHAVRGMGPGLVLAVMGLYLLVKHRDENRKPGGVFIAWAAVPALFLMTAPQLVLSHGLALLYIVPAMSVLITFPLEKIKPGPAYALTAIMLLFWMGQDIKIIRMKAPFHYNLAKLTTRLMGEADGRKAFDSAAIGQLRYYHNIETFHAVGANEPPVGKMVEDPSIGAVLLDTAHGEVNYVNGAVYRLAGRGDLYLAARTSDVELWLRGDGGGVICLANLLEKSERPSMSENFWENPTAEIIADGDVARYGILHHARTGETSVIRFDDIEVAAGAVFRTTAMLDPEVCNPGMSDGVRFIVRIKGPTTSDEASGEIVPDGDGGCPRRPIAIDPVDAPGKIDVELAVSPGGSSAYDRFFWEDPRIEVPKDE